MSSRPALSEEEARAIATTFAAEAARELPAIWARSGSDDTWIPDPPRCDGGRFEDGPDAQWVFLLRIPVPPGVVMDPSHWIIQVDVATKRARFFPVM